MPAWTFLFVLVALTCGPALAGSRTYTLEIPSGRTAHYELDLQVDHPGTLVVHADWSGPTTLAFRIVPPNGMSSVRRGGPSPQLLEAEVSEDDTGTWKLSIHALLSRRAGQGRITVEIPDERPPEAEATAVAKPAAPPEPTEPWKRRREAPREIPSDWRQVVDTTERFRVLVVEREDGAPDACRWQDELLRFLAFYRDRLLETGELPPTETRKLLARTVDVLRKVEEFRTSRDPVVAGPPPADPAMREAWERLRENRTQLLEKDLDELLASVRRERAPSLAEEVWPVRLASCLTACQRHFEQRTRLGEDRATSRELALAQWDRLLAAADAMEAIAGLRVEPIRIGAASD